MSLDDNYRDHFNEIDHFWHLVNPLTIEQAASLIAGFDPNDTVYSQNNKVWIESAESGLTRSDGVSRIETVRVALINAINAKKLKSLLKYEAEERYIAETDNLIERGYWKGEDVKEISVWPAGGTLTEYVINREPSWQLTTVDRDDLKVWLRSHDFKPDFFFRDEAKNYKHQEKGEHTSELLEILNNAIAEFWEGKETNTKNEAIMQWFTDNYPDQKKLSDTVKKSMCTMMRPFKYK